jgi:uncharacterized membrane protein
MYYLNYFFIFSIIGHFIETFIYYNGESGILFGPWTPVYGFGAIIILFIYNYLNKNIKNKYLKIFLLFILSSIILTIIEAIGGYLIEALFHTTFWDYSYYKFHIGKYISLEMALIWGLCSILVIYFIKPLIDKIISKIPTYLTYILFILIIIDLICTIVIKH